MSGVKKLTMQDFEEQRKKQEEDFKAYNIASFQDLPVEIEPARPAITKKSSAVQETMPLTTALPVTNKGSSNAINPNTIL